MSDETKPGLDAAASKSRAPASIDLPKADVKDVTPRAEAETTQAAEAVPATPAQNSRAEADVAAPSPAVATPPAASSPPVAPPARAGGSMPVLGGAVAGAVFGLLGATIHQNYAAPPVTVADGRVAQVEAAIAAVDRKAADAAALEQKLLAQIRTIETRAAAIEQQAAAAAQKAAAVDQKAAGLEQKAAGLLSPVEDRLKSLEALIAEGRDQAGSITKRVDLLAQIEPPKVDVAPLVAPLVSRLDAIEKTLGSTSARLTLGGEAAQALDARIKTAEQAVADLKARKPGETPAAILGVSSLLRRSLDAGEPLGAHLTALAGLGVSEAAIKPLAPFADKPAPRLPALADQLTMLVAGLPKPKVDTPASAGVMDRIRSGLWSQVEVRPAGGVAADVNALAGRSRGKLLAGDLAGALAELAALSPEQRAALQPFSDAVTARAGALDALRNLEAAALAAAARKS